MSERARYAHGVPCWVDLASPEPDASAAFYGGLFGWEPVPSGPAGVFTLAGKVVCGLAPAPTPDTPAAWTTYVAVDDVESTVEVVAREGGQVLAEPTAVGPEGRMASFADPGGARFGVWEAGERPGAQLVDEPGTLVWSELLTRDVERVEPFYREVFGWVDEAGTGEEEDYAVWKAGSAPVGGMLPMGAGFPDDVPPLWMTYFGVRDADATAAEAERLGGTVCVAPTDEQAGRFAIIGDPHGAIFSVIALAGRG